MEQFKIDFFESNKEVIQQQVRDKFFKEEPIKHKKDFDLMAMLFTLLNNPKKIKKIIFILVFFLISGIISTIYFTTLGIISLYHLIF